MRLLLVIGCLLLASCGESETVKLKRENEDLREQVQQLQSRLSDVQEKATQLESSSADLQGQMARFENEDWKDVVPEAQSASEQVESDQDELKEAAQEQ